MQILNEVLNSDHLLLRQRLDEQKIREDELEENNKFYKINAVIAKGVDKIGVLGRNALHIAAYKRDSRMCQLLLEYNADPNIKDDVNGDTAMHIAARLGAIDVAETLYKTGKCHLDLRNIDGQMAYDVAMELVQDHELDLTRLFQEWEGTVTLDDERVYISEGRQKCAKYLSDKLNEDVDSGQQKALDTMVLSNHNRRLMSSMITGKGYSNERIYAPGSIYPSGYDPDPWSEKDIAFFHSHDNCVADVTRGIYTHDVVSRGIRTGMKVANMNQDLVEGRGERLENPRDMDSNSTAILTSSMHKYKEGRAYSLESDIKNYTMKEYRIEADRIPANS